MVNYKATDDSNIRRQTQYYKMKQRHDRVQERMIYLDWLKNMSVHAKENLNVNIYDCTFVAWINFWRKPTFVTSKKIRLLVSFLNNTLLQP